MVMIREVPKEYKINYLLTYITDSKRDEMFVWLKHYISLTMRLAVDPDMDNVEYLATLDGLTEMLMGILPFINIEQYELRKMINTSVANLAVTIVDNQIPIPLTEFEVVGLTGRSILIKVEETEDV
jgi:hypothetical protein|nr:MAG TPA: hypothetical protein [Caudoviricetes sp.]